MVITKMEWKGAEAYQLENELVRAVVLPGMGAKIASFYHKELEFELVAQPNRAYHAAHLGADFSEFDASGFDDAFPNLVTGTYDVGGKAVAYPDHGEIWSAKFACTAEGDALHLSYDSQCLPYHYEKTVSLNGNQLCLSYRVVHTGQAAFPCSWTFHGLVRYEEDMKLAYPKGADFIRDVPSGTALGEVDTKNPRASFPNSWEKVLPREPKAACMVYVDDKVAEGQCGYVYPSQNVRATLSYDETALPYLALWITAGGYRGEYNCAFEPNDAFYEDFDVARARGASVMMNPGEEKAFSLRVAVDKA